MVLVADHGHQYDPAVSGAFEIGIDQLESDIVSRFDDDGDKTPLIEWVRPTEIWLDTAELRQNGYDLTEVSRYIAQLTEAQTRKPGAPMEPGHADDRVFSAAFPTAMLRDLSCERAAAIATSRSLASWRDRSRGAPRVCRGTSRRRWRRSTACRPT